MGRPLFAHSIYPDPDNPVFLQHLSCRSVGSGKPMKSSVKHVVWSFVLDGLTVDRVTAISVCNFKFHDSLVRRVVR